MDQTSPLPTYSMDLIAELNEMYPERVPSRDWSDRDIWAYVGAREVVRGLLRRLEESTEAAKSTEGISHV